MAYFPKLWEREPADLIETGLTRLHSLLTSIGSSLDAAAGRDPSQPPTKAPVNGPADIDQAVAEFANRAYPILLQTLRAPGDFEGQFRQVQKAALQCFGNLDWRDPRASALFPLQLPLSFATLMTEQAARMMCVYESVRGRNYVRSVLDFQEVGTDTQFFASLSYQQLIDNLRDRLERRPWDAGARVELGRTYIKCGLYPDAVRELHLAAQDAAQDGEVRASALHAAAVALYRAGRYLEAAQDASAALAADPADTRMRMWLWYAAQELGEYPHDVPPEHRMIVGAGRCAPTVEFEDVASRIGMDKISGGRGIAVFDFDNDGYLDVAVAAAFGGCTLYRNNRDGTFTDVSVSSGLDACVNGFAVAAADYDNDGFPDLFITRLGFYVGDSVLYHNNGDGTFTDVTSLAGLDCWGPAFVAVWADYDCDGWLDLFVANNMSALDRKVPNRLFHNNGDGTFTEVAEKAGLRTFWTTIGAAWGDYNNDGFPDLFVSNSTGPAQLFRNNGDGTFTDVSVEAGVAASPCLGSVCSWWDYDNDGWLDILQFVWSDHYDVTYTMEHGQGPEEGSPLRIYHNNRDGTFTLRSRDLGIDECWGTMSGAFGDFNNDGHLDLVLGNGSPPMDHMEPLVLLENDGNGRFQNTTFAAGLPAVGKGHGANLADLFGDGRLSALVASGGGYPGDLLAVSVFCPRQLPGNYLNVRLVGTKSNRDAIGARVCLEAGGGRQYREVGGGTHFGCLPMEQHFGLAALTSVDAVEIRWPSGLRQRVENPPINDSIRITEGLAGWERVYPQNPVAPVKK